MTLSRFLEALGREFHVFETRREVRAASLPATALPSLTTISRFGAGCSVMAA